MLKVITDFTEYEPWSGAVENYQDLVDRDMLNEFENLLEECYPEGIELVQINDILWFDYEWVCETLGIERDVE